MNNEALERLRQCTLLRDLGDGDLQALLAHCRLRAVMPGQVLFKQGDPGETLLIVLDGRLQVTLTDAHGQTNEIAAITTGQMVGEMAALDPAPRAATVTAAVPTRLAELSVHGLRALRTAAPAVAATVTAGVIADVTQRLRAINERIEAELDPAAAKAKEAAKLAGAPATASASGSGSKPSGKLGGWFAKWLGRS
jgi:CRP/FNR family cyclic AMP-dependent transcriptional regulator